MGGHDLVSLSDVSDVKQMIIYSGLTISVLVYAAWSSAVNYWHSDKGGNGVRTALEP